jgi:hypothetical protein
MKILCYGDSNTWGFSPINGSRFPEDIRWPGVLRRCLGEGFTVIDNARDIQASLPVLVLAPLPINVGRDYHAYYHEQIDKSFDLIAAFENLSAQKGCHFLDPSQVISASRHDGVHIEAEEHIKLGLHLCVIVRDLISGGDSPPHRQPGL